GELSPGELSPGELSPGELSPGELSPGELSPGELSPGELSPGELSPGELSPGELFITNFSELKFRHPTFVLNKTVNQPLNFKFKKVNLLILMHSEVQVIQYKLLVRTFQFGILSTNNK